MSFCRLILSCVVCLGTFQASLASAIFAAGTDAASSEFGVGREVGTLGTTLFVLGFASGPIVWAPVSELFGRRWPLIIGMFGDSVFGISSAVAKDIQTLLLCRFFAGVFGASQLSIVPAVLSDIFDNIYRGPAIAIYSLTVFVGPFAAPFLGAFISQSSLGWRWTLYITSFVGFLTTILMLLLLRETYAPAILVKKAAEMRHCTQTWAIHAKHEELEVDMQAVTHKYLSRPIQMLATEPVILLVSLYMSFVYGLVYALVEAIPYIYSKTYHMQAGPAALPCIALIVGQLIATTFILSQHSAYVTKLAANEGIPVPEWRLSPTLIGAPTFTIGIFWLAWTGYTSSIHWIVPTLAGVPIGFGVLCIFLPCFNYLVDSYLPLAASTVAANIIARSAIAAGFPLFTRQMFENLGIQWAGTLLGCLAAVMVPIPFVFRKMGADLRKKSRLATSS